MSTGISSAKITIGREDPDQPEIIALLAENDLFYENLYPAESNHLIGVEALQGPNVAFFVVRLDGQAKGYGACARVHDYGEIKRVYVPEDVRGLGLGRLILESIERHAVAEGINFLRAETGIKQPEALGLYYKFGYRSIPPFGSYQPDPLSVFLEKQLDVPAVAQSDKS